MATLFTDMPIGQRNNWLAWANDHDWGAGPARWNADGTMHVEGAGFDRNDSPIIETLAAATPQQLRDWAGY